MSNSQLSPSNLERPTSNNGSQTPWSTHSAVVKRGGQDSVVCVHPLWEIDLCDHSCCIRLYVFVRVQTWTNTMRRHELVLRGTYAASTSPVWVLKHWDTQLWAKITPCRVSDAWIRTEMIHQFTVSAQRALESIDVGGEEFQCFWVIQT